MNRALHTMEHQPIRGAFIEAMSRVASTVSIVATDGPAGRAGATVSAMSSVSADGPAPTLLVCLYEGGSVVPALRRNGVFCVNVLRDEQAWLADAFAGRGNLAQPARFSLARWSAAPNGAPRLADALAIFVCNVSASEIVASHRVIFGEVAAVNSANIGTPLIYERRDYARPQKLPDEGLCGRSCWGAPEAVKSGFR